MTIASTIETGASRPIGLVSALMVVMIWSGFIVVSRAGVTSGLTAYDVAALRFCVAGSLTLPFLRAWWPRHLPVGALVFLSVLGPGALYSVVMYLGLAFAPVAYAGVFANGTLPIFTMILAFVLSAITPTRRQIIGVTAILAGAALLGLPTRAVSMDSAVWGIVLFLCASAILSAYTVGLKHWHVTPRQALALVNIPNALVYIPIWYLFLPSTLGEADQTIIVLQALYQGIGPGFLAVVFYTLATTHLGPTATAGFSAMVPASAMVIAIPVLGEWPGLLGWIGMAIVTFGLFLVVRDPRNRHRTGRV